MPVKNNDDAREEMRRAIEAWKGARVLILGDMILDEFILGRTDRVSREAPVVVVRYDDTSYSPGGAANAAQNVVALGGRAVPVSVIGTDVAGVVLKELLAERRMTVRSVVAARGIRTTTKTRVMAGDFHAQRQQVVRIDRENGEPLGARMEDRILSVLRRELPRAQAALMSDYAGGVCTPRIIREALALCRRSRVPVVVDSRYSLVRFKGATTATPNEVEASEAAGIPFGGKAALERIGRTLLERLGARSILVTRGKFGMMLFEAGRRSVSVDVVGSREATDVTGAGDTVAAAVALSLAAGLGMPLAMRLANVAASIVVMKRGTAVATVPELLERIDELGTGERSSRE
jgi:D-glycero-beta-D-manno-heptose-7-phosphate kinase